MYWSPSKGTSSKVALKKKVQSQQQPSFHQLSLTHLKACNTVFDGPACGPAGAFNFSSKTLTMLHKNNKFNSIDKQTGATRMFEKRLSFIQHLKKNGAERMYGR
jgi:hypothetical protein